jgi:methionyl aminopeptidase
MIKLKTPRDIEMIVCSGRILAGVLKKLTAAAQIGTTLNFLDELARRLIKEAGAKPAFLNYRPTGSQRPFPAAVCLSLNEQVVHGLPSLYKLKSGDLLKIDLGVNYGGYISDAGLTLGIGEISLKAQKLIEATQKSLEAAINEIKPGKHLGDLGWAIEITIKKSGFSVIKELTGHGVGFKLHEDPVILNYGKKGEGLELKSGMVLAIEPMAALGGGKVIQRSDDSFVTADNSLTAHFEHTVAVTETGYQILTL